MAGVLRYDADGLRSFAAACEQHALDVCVHDYPAMPASASQSTIDAVAGLHAATSSTGEVLASRIRSTASAVASAADRYAHSETRSADALTAAGDAFA